jgi:hypothetical protein
MQEAIRRFSLLDAMLVIAATGVGITAIQAILRMMRRVQIGFGTYSIWFILASPMVGMWCLALLLASLFRQRGQRRRLFRMPGVTASCTIWIVFLGSNWGWIWRKPGVLPRPDSVAVYMFWNLTTHWGGLAILAVWITQAVAGCWRPAPVWIDQSGRLFGLFWVGAYVFRILNI